MLSAHLAEDTCNRQGPSMHSPMPKNGTAGDPHLSFPQLGINKLSCTDQINKKPKQTSQNKYIFFNGAPRKEHLEITVHRSLPQDLGSELPEQSLCAWSG
ncbi:hypothetical protein KIL84_020169 [Mauremys mutica]|uniref:Uncharacterized protein n=1 Tax=Mauremys mutica TaxID=74926 RepID=A0A9D3XYB6_9SAUR|nr:hypothetical protein KIL84_020169 [Mauremys mutica]